MPIDVRRDGPVAVVVIDAPARRNALSRAMVEALADLWPRLEKDGSVRAVLLRGAGGTFCAGADLAEPWDEMQDRDDLIAAALCKTGRFGKPLVTAIRGACVAGGLELVLSSDLRVAAEDARIGLPEVRWGIFPSGGAAAKLADQIGYARAMTLLLTGDLISGREAGAIGLVSHVAPDSEVEALAARLAATIAQNSPRVVQAVKTYVAGGRADGYAAREAEERAILRKIRHSGDRSIGVKAFLEKSRPQYDE